MLNFLGIALLTVSIVQCLMLYFFGSSLKMEMYLFRNQYIFPLLWMNIFICTLGMYIVYFVKALQTGFTSGFESFILLFLNISLVITAYLVFQDFNQASDKGWVVFPPLSAMNEAQTAQFHVLMGWLSWKNALRNLAYYAQFVSIGSLIYVVFQVVRYWKRLF